MTDQTCSSRLKYQISFPKLLVIHHIESSPSSSGNLASPETFNFPEKESTKSNALIAKIPGVGIRWGLNEWPYILLYHLRTLWLFTQSDLKSMIIPTTTFSVVCSVSRANLMPGQIGMFTIINRIPSLVLWLWLTLLLFNLENQRLPSSILEDSINKPWRPIPSGRIKANHARILVFILMPVVLLMSIPLGTAPQALMQMALTYAYNDLEWADKSFVIRNILNGMGISIYNSGAITILSRSPFGLTLASMKWVAFIGFAVTTTIHVQDLKDQQGDALRERRTLPLVMGDSFARWTIIIAIAGWSLAAPMFWGLGLEGYVNIAAVGMIIVFRILWLRNVEADRRTWTWWCIWMVSLYLLPLWVDFSSMPWIQSSGQLCRIRNLCGGDYCGDYLFSKMEGWDTVLKTSTHYSLNLTHPLLGL